MKRWNRCWWVTRKKAIASDTVTTGAANDIEKATNIAKNMVTRFGMSEKFALMGLATIENQYLGGGARLDCSDVTAADVDTEVMKILKDCYEEAKKLLSENRELMDKLAAHLIEKETITGKEFMKIYREEKGLPEPEEDGEKEHEEKKKIEEKTEKKPEETEGKNPAEPEKEKGTEDDFFSKAIVIEQEKIRDQFWDAPEEKKEESDGDGNGSIGKSGTGNKDLSKGQDEDNHGSGQNNGPVGRFSNTSGNFKV